MKIAVLGAGAMGSLFAAKLSACHDVLILDLNAASIDAIKAEGIHVMEQDGSVLKG